MRARNQLTLALVSALLVLPGSPATAVPDSPVTARQDEVTGTLGPDRLFGTEQVDWMAGRRGGDVLWGLAGEDRLHGNRGRDILFGGPGPDLLNGWADADVVRGGRGPDIVRGRSGPDKVVGGQGADLVAGGGAPDELWGGGGDDVLTGGPGDDVARPGPGADEVRTGRGRDWAVLSVDGDADRLDCGRGRDRVSLVGGTDPLDTLVSCEDLTTAGAVAASGGDAAYLTLHFGRTQWEQRDSTCTTALPNSVTLLEVAQELASRGMKAVGHVVIDRTSSTTTRWCERRFAYATWDDLAVLRDTYKWTFISAGQTYANMTTLTPAEQKVESCGSLQALADHGHNRAHGMFAYPNNKFTTEIQTNVVSTCFAYGRKYGPGLNNRTRLVAPHLQSTISFNGGACSDSTQPCSDPATHGGRRYADPAVVAAKMQPAANQWAAVQFYRFVVGSRSEPTDPTFAWDCTSEDVTQHWTSKAEIYCWEDYKSALDAIPSSVKVTDPLTVARAWGRLPR